jgi:Peptidase A4 family
VVLPRASAGRRLPPWITLLVLTVAVLLSATMTAVGATSGGGGARAGGRMGLAQPALLTSVLAEPSGQRMQSGADTDASSSSNWSGLGGTGTGIEGVEGHWRVPSVEGSPAAGYSSSWVGVDGLEMGSPDLIQAGTEQDTDGGYYAWWEIQPRPAVRIVASQGRPAPVAPGDDITVVVKQSATGIWTIYLRDITRNWYFQQDSAYAGPGHSAEWIEEAPNVDAVQTPIPDFESVHFSGTAVYGSFGAGLGWYSTDLSAANEIVLRDRRNTRTVVQPSAPTATSPAGQQFSDLYLTPPATPSLHTGPGDLPINRR